MAKANAKQLLDRIPSCVKGCFQNGVDATGCNEADYDCYCYKRNHQIVVGAMEICLTNQERRLEKNCTEEEMFQMENRYWMVCEQYWEPTGTAVEPASATMAPKPTTQLTSISSSRPSTVDPTSSDAPDSALSRLKDQQAGLLVGYQVGIVISASLTVILVAAAVFLWLKERKKRRALEEQRSKLRNALWASIGLENGKGQPFEMEGDELHVLELRGDPRTPELEDRPNSSTDNDDITLIRDVRRQSAPRSSATPPPKTAKLGITTGRTRAAPSAEMGSTDRSHRASADSGSSSFWSSSLRPPPLRLLSRPAV
ncbi:hypothetical protein ACJZ2D_015179 [Fusarium nematophilum]